MTTQAIAPMDSSTAIPRRLRLPVLTLWGVITLLACASFVWMVISAYRDPTILSASLSYPPLPQAFKWAYWFYAFVVFTGYIATGLFIVWRRSWDWIVILMSLLLIIFGTLALQETEYLLISIFPRLHIFFTGIQSISFVSLIILLFHFPDGGRYPRWSIWIILISVLLVLPIIYVLIGSDEFSLTYRPLALVGAIILIALGLAAQTFRFRTIATPRQRQQVKWVVIGLVGPILALILYSQLSLFKTFGELSVFIAVSNEFVQAIMSLAFPVAVMVSILRYRLWDVDFIINRSLVYTLLTIILAVIFALGFFLIRAVLRGIGLEQDLIAVGVPLLAAALIFNPVRTRLRRFVDRRFYGIQLDYQEAVKAYEALERQADQSGDTRTAIGDYTDLKLIGRGGMGEVYRGQNSANQIVAIKVLPGQHDPDDEAFKRFSREAQTIQNLDHPHIVKVHTIGSVGEKPYMVMDYIDGGDLSNLIKEQRQLSIDDAILILNGIASALDYAHEQDVIHRDVKPGNVLVEKNTLHSYLMDFGIARIASAMTRLTATGGMVGTLDYIAPEQIQGAKDVDNRADIYSFGVMAYQMLTGQLPFKHNNPGAMVMAHLMKPAPDPRKLLPVMPDPVADAIIKAMSKQPDQRYASAGEMIAAMLT